MKTAVKMLTVIGIVVLAVAALLAVLVLRLLTAPMVPAGYTKTVKTGGGIEAAYLAEGGHKVKYAEAPAPCDWKKFELYYPAELEQGENTYPVVVFVNGTGVYGSKYKALFRHLASWGFIVLGNEDPSTCTGDSADATLAYLLAENSNPDSVFFHRVDLESIGISGHSQGGVGVFNAVTATAHSSCYKTAVALSPTQEEGAAALNMPYDLAKLTIPTLLLAGTAGDFETQLVIPIEQMEKMYQRMDVPKVMARKTGCEHGQTLYEMDGYVTAWFMWHLQDDERAAGAFTGDSAEISRNPLYQDVKIAYTR